MKYMGQKTNAYIILNGKLDGKSILRRSGKSENEP
jgi:hypothetical protein